MYYNNSNAISSDLAEMEEEVTPLYGYITTINYPHAPDWLMQMLLDDSHLSLCAPSLSLDNRWPVRNLKEDKFDKTQLH